MRGVSPSHDPSVKAFSKSRFVICKSERCFSGDKYVFLYTKVFDSQD